MRHARRGAGAAFGAVVGATLAAFGCAARQPAVPPPASGSPEGAVGTPSLPPPAAGSPEGAARQPALTSPVAGGPEAISLLGAPLLAMRAGPDSEKLESELAAAREELARSPGDPERVIWVGRRLGYLWRMREAIEVFTEGIRAHPDHAALYRHRGHRYISIRRFDDAVADLERAAQLLRGKPDEIEPDGAPNNRNIPLTTIGFNVWYHLGLARYLTGDYEAAAGAYREALDRARGHADNLVAASDWMYMALCRLGRRKEARSLLESITPKMEIMENFAYHRRLLLYKGEVRPEQVLDPAQASPLEIATLGYGLGNWHLDRGDVARAAKIFRQVVDTGHWPAFGVIAAEVELARRSDGP